MNNFNPNSIINKIEKLNTPKPKKQIEINNLTNKSDTKKTSEPIIGQAIFDGIITNYLCDSGADISMINEKLLNKLKTDKDSFDILPYYGNQLNSCSGKITVYGSVTIRQCIIDTKFI